MVISGIVSRLTGKVKEDCVTKLTKAYIIVMAILIGLTLVVAVWHSHEVTAAETAVNFAGHAGKNNGGVAANYANFTANTANNLRFFLLLCGSLTAAAGIWGLVEYIILPLINLSRIGAITQVTYHEALYQPFTLIVFAMCIVAIVTNIRQAIPRYFPIMTCQRATGLLIRVSMVRFSISSSITFAVANTMMIKINISTNDMATSRYILVSSPKVLNGTKAVITMAAMHIAKTINVKG